MNHLIVGSYLRSLTQHGKVFRQISSVNVDTYCYLVSRIVEAAMKGERNTTISVEGYQGIQEIADIINSVDTNRLYIDIIENEAQIQWEVY